MTKEYTVHIKNSQELIDTQNYFFNKKISWSQVGFNILYMNENALPVYISIEKLRGKYYMHKINYHDYHLFLLPEKIVNASTLLRKDKLKKIAKIS